MKNLKNNKVLSLFASLLTLLLMVSVVPERAFSQNGEITIPETVLIKAGSFTMGTNVMDADGWTGATRFKESPAHEVTISYDFYIGTYEVTNEEYADFVDADGYEVKDYWLIDPEDNEEAETGWDWKEEQGRIAPGYHLYATDEDLSWDLTKDPYWIDDPYSNQATTPVIGVSWYEAYAYCKWLSSVTGETYRLPTSAEWEYAARGTESFRFPWGNEYLSNEEMCGEPGSGAMANCWPAEGETSILDRGEGLVAAPVGSYPGDVSPWGVYDMAANVIEFTTDWFQFFDYYQQVLLNPNGVVDPTGPSIGRPPWIIFPPLLPFGSAPTRVYKSYGFDMGGNSTTNYNRHLPTSYPLRGAHRMWHDSDAPDKTVGIRVFKEIE